MSVKVLASLLALTSATSAFAQVANPAPSNIDDRVRRQEQSQSAAEQQAELMTGDTDIILLERTKLFTLRGAASVVHSSNASLTPVNPASDTLFQLDAGLRIATRIGEKVDVWGDIGIAGSRYAKNGALGYDALTAEIGLATDIKGIAITASYEPSIIYETGFARKQLTQHRFRLAVSKRFKVGRLSIDPSIEGERTISSPSDYNNWAGGATLTLSTPFGKNNRFLAYTSASYRRRSYDDYFEGLVGVARRDNNWSGSAGIRFQISRRVDASAGYSYQRNYSTSDVNSYQAHSGQLGLSARIVF